MNNISIVKINMVKERTLSYATNTVSDPQNAYDILKKFIETCCCNDRENMIVMCLNTKNKVVALNLVSIGSLNDALVHPREVFKAAILSNAHSIILAHNHPSGDPTPSREDREITRHLQEAGELMGIPVMDSLILGDNTYVSMKDRGMM